MREPEAPGYCAASGGASVGVIARTAGVTKPVLYDHFASKLALYQAVLESIRGELLSRGAAISSELRGPEERFRAAVDAFFSFAQEQPCAIRVLLHEPHEDAAAEHVWRAVQNGASAGIAAFLETIWPVAQGWTRIAAAECIKSALHGLALWWRAHPYVERQALTELVCQIAWDGLQARVPRQPENPV